MDSEQRYRKPDILNDYVLIQNKNLKKTKQMIKYGFKKLLRK